MPRAPAKPLHQLPLALGRRLRVLAESLVSQSVVLHNFLLLGVRNGLRSCTLRKSCQEGPGSSSGDLGSLRPQVTVPRPAAASHRGSLHATACREGNPVSKKTITEDHGSTTPLSGHVRHGAAENL